MATGEERYQATSDEGEIRRLRQENERLREERDGAINAQRLIEALRAEAVGAMRRMESVLGETRVRLSVAEAKLRKLTESRG